MAVDRTKGTVWPDVSEHQGRPVDDTMPHRLLAYRVNDGTYVDRQFRVNDTWARRTRRLVGYLAYLVWPRSVGWSTWQATLAAYQAELGDDHRPRLVVLVDVESWGRADLARNHSADLEALRQALVAWLGSLRPAWQRRWPVRALYRSADNRRVVGYGNRGDLLTMSPGVKWRSVILADYSSSPTPRTLGPWRVIARQYTSSGSCPPFGSPCDLNRAQLGPRRLARALGLGRWRWTP